uniref:Uncharacterized protein n=1 Tax=Anguilla anguilla TaxID=7936 RepID=A0A0E9X819_ANGAN
MLVEHPFECLHCGFGKVHYKTGKSVAYRVLLCSDTSGSWQDIGI